MSEQRFSLDTFDVETFRFQNIGKTVYSKGTGPGVVVLAEMPGIHPLVIRFAERVAAAGFKTIGCPACSVTMAASLPPRTPLRR